MEIFHQPFTGGDWVAVILLSSIVGGLLIGVIAVVTSQVRDMRRDDMDATLKMEMIQRGMSADEITKVLEATSSSADVAAWESDECKHQRRAARRAMRDAMRAAKHGHGHA
jgi:hypothetical protein